jgi:hypothetical protein
MTSRTSAAAIAERQPPPRTATHPQNQPREPVVESIAAVVEAVLA